MKKPVVINEEFDKKGKRISITICTENPYREELHIKFVRVIRLIKGEKITGIALSSACLPNKRRVGERDEQEIAPHLNDACWNLAHKSLLYEEEGTLF